MRLPLIPHPLTPCGAAIRIEVALSSLLEIEFRVTGDVDALLFPPSAEGRADGLWQHTCFEAFWLPLPGVAYCEFNFAPSKQWAAYRFDAYREGMRALDGIAPPAIEVERADALFVLRAGLHLPFDTGGRLGLSAVIEERDGRKSYWALAHPRTKPDFHDPDCFSLELPAA